MDEVLHLYHSLREKAQRHGLELRALLGSAPGEYPAALFDGMIFNHVTLCLELLSYYDAAWRAATGTNAASIQQARTDNTGRVIMLEKLTFIATLSSLEHVFKEYIERFPGKIGTCRDRNDRVYLSSIVTSSESNGVISASDLVLWRGLIKLRNSLVHNNGIAEEDAVFSYPNCQVNLVRDTMTIGSIILFAHLTDWLLDAGREWVIEMNPRP